LNQLPNAKRLSFIFVCTAFLSLSTSYADEKSITDVLGTSAEIIKKQTSTKIAKLRTVSVEESRQNALKTNNRIAGYPLTSAMMSLNKTQSTQLAKLILDSNNYANIRQRCLNRFFNGIRFIKDDKIIEVAIGVPCNQLLLVFKDSKNNKWWGGTLGNSAAEKTKEIFQYEK